LCGGYNDTHLLFKNKVLILNNLEKESESLVFPYWRLQTQALAECIRESGGEMVISIMTNNNEDYE
jgi:hypothetical protein